jgi:hypothetical protein
VEAERCWEVKCPAQGRWKQKGGWVESQGKGDYLGHFLPPVFIFIVIRAIGIATEKER